MLVTPLESRRRRRSDYLGIVTSRVDDSMGVALSSREPDSASGLDLATGTSPSAWADVLNEIIGNQSEQPWKLDF